MGEQRTEANGDAVETSSAQQQNGGSFAAPVNGLSFEVPSINLPRGGGAIRSIGEKFSANPVTDTGSMSVSLATSPGRSVFGPDLSLAYDSGSGNGPFGLGWSFSLPAITRKTDKGLPRYQDAAESDEFILSDAEDLVPCLEQDAGGNWQPQSVQTIIIGQSSYDIRRYRPRVEGLFERIEKWTKRDYPQEVFWRSITRDSETTWYGKTPERRIFDESHQSRAFSWFTRERQDDKGNVISYEYAREDSANLELTQIHEQNRQSEQRETNRYIKRLKFGNRSSYFPLLADDQPWPTVPGDGRWLFEVVFDYGENHYAKLDPVHGTSLIQQQVIANE